MTKSKKIALKMLSVLGVACIASGSVLGSFSMASAKENLSDINKIKGVKTNQEQFYNKDVIYQLPESVKKTDEISVIISMSTKNLLQAYKDSGVSQSVGEYATTNAGQAVLANVAKENKKLIKLLNNSGIQYTLGTSYDTLLSGIEVTIKAKDFSKLGELVPDAKLILGDTYEKAQTEVVHNYVDVYETGIFDSSSNQYQGDGVVVAVLDTGLDYTHTAFSTSNFTSTNKAFTLANVSEKVPNTTAARFTAGLTGEDVYVNEKVPFAYDYADKDPDVLPINSEHGTHVAGIIAGKDDTITGVAPNAQLAIMKVFSDTAQGARDSWILGALEDCVVMGVDVINMSLGSSCGFTRETDEEEKNIIYDSIREMGISLICAASNDGNATQGSEKNGSLGLTSNPDSGTVGAPSTYEAALSVASVDGVKTPYIMYGEDIIYFTEASTSSAKQKDFVDEILKTVGPDVTSHEFEYVTIPGLGRSSDYMEDDYSGKIVLVRRGQTTFEEKVRIALSEKKASGIIIYNNVSGEISMSVGASVGAVCSISQDEGEKLAESETGVLKISKGLTAGPFMSSFSSWGPTSDLKIKPEITAHGGEILSAVPGQAYDRLSGTSMAAPNQAGATALIRQYVKYSGAFGSNLSATQVTAIVNQLMMSTTDIVMNKNGLAYSVRKQGSGLVNIASATTSPAYLTTFNKDGSVMDRTKLELGDDKNKTGVYTMKFAINNISDSSLSYNVDAIVMTEGVSPTYTGHSEQVVTQDGYLLEGSEVTVGSISGAGSVSGNTVTVNAKGTATVEVKVTLSEEDKKYIEDSFAHGMYVEGFITLDAKSGTNIDLNVAYLAYYGDWTEAPIFDEEYYDTNKDELNAGIDANDKMMPDAYATRIIGGLYQDYITTLGEYYFIQDPSATKIAANKEHIAISNQADGANSAVNSIEYIWAGFLRNVKTAEMKVVEDSTGEVIFERTETNLRKSHNGGGAIYYSSIDMEFSALEQNLKNNTKYTVTVTTYIDYGTHESQKNVRNVFEFPLYIDFEAPLVEDVVYRTEYDKTTKKTTLYADIKVYDNHYAMGMQLGQIVPADPASGYSFTMESFGKYITPIYSNYNSTSTVTVNLTDYISQIKQSSGLNHNDNNNSIELNNNSFIATVYDYAMNVATYEIRLPDEIIAMAFTEDEIKLNPNETKDLATIMNVYPATSWIQTLDFESSDPSVVAVVNQTALAKSSGTAVITAKGKDAKGNLVTASLNVTVLGEGDEGYVGNYTEPAVNKFDVTGYKTNKAFYSITSSERDIGITDGTYDFGGAKTLSMYPSESVTLKYILDAYNPENAEVKFKSLNSRIATVTEDGTIVAQAKGTTVVTVNILYNGKSQPFSATVSVTVKDPFTTNSIYLMSYRGLGGEVVIPADRGITTIYAYAFSHYEYVPKDLDNGDEITDEDPYASKQMYIGDNTITKIVIPEGVETIEQYAFTQLLQLEEVVLPSTLTKIGYGAFMGCEKLTKINLDKVKFINKEAFKGTALEQVKLDSVVAIGDYTFASTKLTSIVLPASSQSLGLGAFMDCEYLTNVTFDAPKIKVGAMVFANCKRLSTININAAVIPTNAFNGCSELSNVTLGKDVAVISELAFTNTAIEKFTINARNTILKTTNNGAFIMKGTELVAVAPLYVGANNTITTDATAIGTGAFMGNQKVAKVVAPNATTIGAWALAGCRNLREVQMPALVEIGDYAFAETKLAATPDLSKVTSIGDYAFAITNIKSVTIANDTQVGAYAFLYCEMLETITIGDNVTLDEAAFYFPMQLYTFENTGSLSAYTPYNYYVYDENGNVVETYSYYKYNFDYGAMSNVRSITIGKNAVIGIYAFANNTKVTNLVLGEGAVIGSHAFYNMNKLTEIDLSSAKEIGDYAFAGSIAYDLYANGSSLYYAFNRVWQDGKSVPVSNIFSTYASKITEIELSAATKIGEGAFANNVSLTTVSFGGSIKEVAPYAFASCINLSTITLPENITAIGAYAFFSTAVKSFDLSNIETIGEYAFARSAVESVEVKEGAIVEEGAFANATKLATVTNIETIKSIGSYAFANTALTSINLKAVETIGDYAFESSKITTVVFGDKIQNFGENPFAHCEIETFGKQSTTTLPNGEEVVTVEETYKVNAAVQVINGVLYQTVPNGLELVSYPLLKADANYTVEEGTVRITGRAFIGTSVVNVTLPTTLKALGDKAFYGCSKLSLVTFKSYAAPLLEEEYDESYATNNSLPFSGKYGDAEGLGISKYYMWNISSSLNNFYYGANFVNYVGQVKDKIVMVKPSNGQNYDSFIFGQYFGTVVEGSVAPMTATAAVIDLINALPANITMANEQQVIEARAAYDSIALLEQKALITNYTKLTNAESTIEYLKSREEEPQVDPEPEIPNKEEISTETILLITTVVFGAAFLGMVAFVVIKAVIAKKKN